MQTVTNQTWRIADCLDVMRGMDDNEYDLILTDPPYGIGAYSTGSMGGGVLAKQSVFEPTTWDNNRLPKTYFDEMQRVSKNQIIFGGNYYTDYLCPSSCWIVWDKDNSTNKFADAELAWTSFSTAVRLHRHRWQGFWQENMKHKEKRIHPTQKPVPLFMWILDRYSIPGDKILDPFLGSGTTLAACRRVGRDCLGIEIDPVWEKYYDDRAMTHTPDLFSYGADSKP